MEEVPENSKESSHSAHANEMGEWNYYFLPVRGLNLPYSGFYAFKYYYFQLFIPGW